VRSRILAFASLGLGLALALSAAGCGGASVTPTQQKWATPPPVTLQAGSTYTADVATNYGSFTISLFAQQDPVTVNNFVFLAKNHFYAGNTFFRIIKTFMVQTGDPNNNGTGGPGYRFGDELPPPQAYGPGIVAMANSGPNTNGSQFFVCTGKDCATLPPQYTQLGKVTAGMDVVQKIAAIPVGPNPVMNNEPSLPKQDAHITGITIHQG